MWTFSPQIEQLQASLQAVSEQKSQLEEDLQRNMEMVRWEVLGQTPKVLGFKCDHTARDVKLPMLINISLFFRWYG